MAAHVEHMEHRQTGRLTWAVSRVFTEVGHVAPANDLCGCLSFSVPSPSRGHTATSRHKAPIISHLVGVDYPAWPKAPGRTFLAVPSQEQELSDRDGPGLLS